MRGSPYTDARSSEAHRQHCIALSSRFYPVPKERFVIQSHYSGTLFGSWQQSTIGPVYGNRSQWTWCMHDRINTDARPSRSERNISPFLAKAEHFVQTGHGRLGDDPGVVGWIWQFTDHPAGKLRFVGVEHAGADSAARKWGFPGAG